MTKDENPAAHAEKFADAIEMYGLKVEKVHNNDLNAGKTEWHCLAEVMSVWTRFNVLMDRMEQGGHSEKHDKLAQDLMNQTSTNSPQSLNDWIDDEVRKRIHIPVNYYDLLDVVGEIARGAALQVIGNKAALINNLANMVHQQNVDASWWTDLKTGEDLHGKRNIGEMLCLVHSEMLCLVHSEISEAMEGHRKGLMDDKLPHRPMFRVELIDALIRILDLLGADNKEHPAGTIFQEKLAYNAERADHKPENRIKAGGKAY